LHEKRWNDIASKNKNHIEFITNSEELSMGVNNIAHIIRQKEKMERIMKAVEEAPARGLNAQVYKREEIREAVEMAMEMSPPSKTALLYYNQLQPHYQMNPFTRDGYTAHLVNSFTYSPQAYQRKAKKETAILYVNGRVPTGKVVWHLLRVYTVTELKIIRDKVFRVLRKRGIIAVVAIEITRSRPRTGKPTGKCHFHFLLDDQRNEEEIRAIFNEACERSGLTKNEFRIDYKPNDEGLNAFYYFTKYNYAKRVILFRKHFGIKKFSQIGGWFYKTKSEIREEMKAYAKSKKTQ
jgi:hypothetical protein